MCRNQSEVTKSFPVQSLYSPLNSANLLYTSEKTSNLGDFGVLHVSRPLHTTNSTICRLCLYETSYFPSTLKLWNDLNTETRNIPTLLQFKSSIRHQLPRVGEPLSVGERKYNIILTRIRHRCSSLNADLFHVNIVPFSNYSYGVLVENAEHSLYECTLNNTQKQIVVQTIRQIQTIPIVNFDQTVVPYTTFKLINKL